jgi:hypothetical protein
MEKEKEGLKTKICKICKLEKSLKSFNKNGSFRDGYQSRCKLCVKNGYLIHKDNIIDKDYEWPDSFRLRNPTKSDYTEMWKLMKNIGYDLNRSISDQFCEKYGFEVTGYNINKDKITYFSPKECGLT